MTLLMRDQENREIGREESILGTVSSLRYFNTPDHDILLKIQEEAEHYMEQNDNYRKRILKNKTKFWSEDDEKRISLGFGSNFENRIAYKYLFD